MICLCSLYSISQERINQTDSQGMKQGKWVSRYPSGKPKYEGAFDRNKPVGEWKRYHENGKIKALMSYRSNSERVSASLFDEEGVLYARGVFEGTLRDSTWQFFKGDHLSRTENYHAGKRDGKSIDYDQDAKVISEKNWKNDLLDGMASEFYPDGKKRNEVGYTEGRKNGSASFYDENGSLSMQGRYQDDLSDGDWKMFDKEGKVFLTIRYNKGDIINKGELDSLQINEFKKYEKARGKISEPKANESGFPERE